MPRLFRQHELLFRAGEAEPDLFGNKDEDAVITEWDFLGLPGGFVAMVGGPTGVTDRYSDRVVVIGGDPFSAKATNGMEVCAAVQRGLQSRTSQPRPLTHLEMPVWLFHHYLAARTRHTWPTNDRPAA